MSAPEPIATGNLAKTPLPQLLVYLDQKKLSGTLAVWPEALADGGETPGQDRILLLKGCPVAGKLLEPATTLREGLLRLFARRKAPYAFYEDNLLGDDRISGRVDPLSLITEAFRRAAPDAAVDELLQRLGATRLRMQAGIDLARYEFDPKERGLIELMQAEPANAQALIEGSGLLEARARRLIYLLVISKAATTYVDAAAAAAAAAVAPQPVAAPAEEPRQSAPKPQPAKRAEAPKAAVAPAQPAPPASPAQASAASEPEAAEAKSPSFPPPSIPPPADPAGLHGGLDRLQSIPPPPGGMSQELSQRWLKVVAKGRLVENQNYFEMLELDKDAKSTDARSKFYQLAKEWHPDRLPQELQPLREYVQIIFSYMSEANATLGDEGQRIKYLQAVREGGGTPATERLMQTILDTAMEYERVLVLARKHAYDEAIDLLKRILSVVKDDAEYHMMYASLLMQKFPGQGQEAPLSKMLESVDQALQLNPKHEKANMLKGQILRRMGRGGDALEFFKRAAEINPRNIEAMREVRVASMRSESMAPKAKSKGGKKEKEDAAASGLLGKLFKKG